MTNHDLIIECAPSDASIIRTALDHELSICAAEIPHGTITERKIRGADAVTTIQLVVHVSVNVDVAKILLALSSLLAAYKGRVILAGKAKTILSRGDILELPGMKSAQSGKGLPHPTESAKKDKKEEP